MNRSENCLVAKLFSGYLFNEYIFPQHEPLKYIFGDVYGKDPETLKDATFDITYFFRPKDVFRQPNHSGTTDGNNLKNGRSAFSNGHFDVAVLIKPTGTSKILLLLEVKYLSDVDTGQLLHETQMCKTLALSSLEFGKELIKFDEVYLLTIATFANLHYSRALQVDSNSRVTIPGTGIMPDFVRVITFDKLAEVIIRSLKISEFHNKVGCEILKSMYYTADAKTLTIDGIAKGQPRHLLHSAKRLIEMQEIL